MNLVVGVTGLLGGLIVDKLLARGKPVRALVDNHRSLWERKALSPI